MDFAVAIFGNPQCNGFLWGVSLPPGLRHACCKLSVAGQAKWLSGPSLHNSLMNESSGNRLSRFTTVRSKAKQLSAPSPHKGPTHASTNEGEVRFCWNSVLKMWWCIFLRQKHLFKWMKQGELEEKKTCQTQKVFVEQSIKTSNAKNVTVALLHWTLCNLPRMVCQSKLPPSNLPLSQRSLWDQICHHRSQQSVRVLQQCKINLGASAQLCSCAGRLKVLLHHCWSIVVMKLAALHITMSLWQGMQIGQRSKRDIIFPLVQTALVLFFHKQNLPKKLAWNLCFWVASLSNHCFFALNTCVQKASFWNAWVKRNFCGTSTPS